MIAARVLADSVNPAGQRLTTMEWTFPRWILAEVNTHRMLSRNSASSRAIPTSKILREVLRNPAVPVAWGANQSGMQAHSDLGRVRGWLARRLFLGARFPAVVAAWLLTKVGLHKQITNRIVEPWMWHTAIVTATEWDNLFKLRDHDDAQPEFHALARAARGAMQESRIDGNIQRLEWGEWHTPLMEYEELCSIEHYRDAQGLSISPQVISAARCARVSFVRHLESRDWWKDQDLGTKLSTSGHWSPFEHVAQADPAAIRSGNLTGGWLQFRKTFPGEDGRVTIDVKG